MRHLSSRGPQTVTRLTRGSGISRQAISKHLGILERAGLVHSAWRGRERLLALRAARLQGAREFLTAVSTEWEAALDRLRRMAES